MTILKSICVEISGRQVLSIDRLEISDGDKIAVLGGNGSGKTTLLNLIFGDFEAFSGILEKKHDFLYLKQNKTDIGMDNETNYEFLSKIGDVPFHNEITACSGGEKIKLYLSNVLENEYTNLILDEPTTNLDLKSTRFLIQTLKNHQGIIIFSTHNRELVENIATKIWIIENHNVKEYKGGWESYIYQKELEESTLQNRNTQIQEQKEQLEAAIENKRESLKKISDITVRKKNKRINPGRLAQSKSKGSSQKGIARQIKSLEKKLGALPTQEDITDRKNIEFPLVESLALNSKIPIIANGLTICMGDRILLDNISFQIAAGEKVAFVGNNGTGKTTLLNYIYNRGESISVSSNVEFSYVKQGIYFVQRSISLISYAMLNTKYSYDFVVKVLKQMGFDECDLEKEIRIFSMGEQLRAVIATSILTPSNILILDEPTNYLDINVMMGLERLIKNYPGTVVFTSHDYTFVEKTATVIYELSGCKLRRIK
ncbi:ribosomal protection-like ABC-F family protein [Facklamia sp. P9177]|uniref:ribosomal protection-like ABC-F family protein n=1 Tax=Facklamia sp. P9177 TaxID=3421945 RepID=UPI003D1863EC